MWSDFLSLVPERALFLAWKTVHFPQKNHSLAFFTKTWSFLSWPGFHFCLARTKPWQGDKTSHQPACVSQKTRPTRYKNSLLLSPQLEIQSSNMKSTEENMKRPWATSTQAMFELLRTRGLKFCWIFHGNCRYTEASTHFAELWWRWHPYWLQFRSTWDALGIYLLIRSNCKKLIPVYI